MRSAPETSVLRDRLMIIPKDFKKSPEDLYSPARSEISTERANFAYSTKSDILMNSNSDMGSYNSDSRLLLRANAYNFGEVHSDDYLVQDYHMLTESDGIDNQPTLSLLRVDGIQKMPLPPIKSVSESGATSSHGGGRSDGLTDEERRLRKVRPDVKKLNLGNR